MFRPLIHKKKTKRILQLTFQVLARLKRWRDPDYPCQKMSSDETQLELPIHRDGHDNAREKKENRCTKLVPNTYSRKSEVIR